jgi:hypothetical protein
VDGGGHCPCKRKWPDPDEEIVYVSLPWPDQVEFINEDKDSMKLRKDQPKRSQNLKRKKRAPAAMGWHEMNRKQ